MAIWLDWLKDSTGRDMSDDHLDVATEYNEWMRRARELGVPEPPPAAPFISGWFGKIPLREPYDGRNGNGRKMQERRDAE